MTTITSPTTNYQMHSVICMFVFTGVGFGLFGQLERFELLYVVFATWIFLGKIKPCIRTEKQLLRP